MSHYTKALELLGRADKCEACREAYGEADQNVLLSAALIHAMLALVDAVEGTRGPWCDEQVS